jgi:hypothetical protein
MLFLNYRLIGIIPRQGDDTVQGAVIIGYKDSPFAIVCNTGTTVEGSDAQRFEFIQSDIRPVQCIVIGRIGIVNQKVLITRVFRQGGIVFRPLPIPYAHGIKCNSGLRHLLRSGTIDIGGGLNYGQSQIDELG